MKELMRIGWVLLIQYISSRSESWDSAVIIFVLATVFSWQIIFSAIDYKLHNDGKVSGRDFSVQLYSIISPMAVFSPIICMVSFSVLAFLRACGIEGMRSKFSSWKKQVVIYRENYLEFDCDSLESERTNPATGLVMSGGTDVAGNSYGVSGYP
ncbi:hypothetical protein ACLECX_00485 [Lonsdalea quercina]|uniref:hypothetical protein n=1 Tax=Lonsdalea quercina TaxID=71657 RepID=UPI00397494C8